MRLKLVGKKMQVHCSKIARLLLSGEKLRGDDRGCVAALVHRIEWRDRENVGSERSLSGNTVDLRLYPAKNIPGISDFFIHHERLHGRACSRQSCGISSIHGGQIRRYDPTDGGGRIASGTAIESANSRRFKRRRSSCRGRSTV